jgi:TRAP transporter 4TM/12TM fusion protein
MQPEEKQKSMEAVKKDSDRQIPQRRPTGVWKIILGTVAVSFVLFHLYTSFAGPLPNLRQRAVHVGFAFILTFSLIKPFASVKKDWENRFFLILDMVLISLVVVVCSFILVKYNWIMEHPAESTHTGLILGSIGLLLALEAGRRTVGILFPLLTAFFILYALLGQYIPDIPMIGDYLDYWGHRGFSLRHIIQVMYLSDQGLWGFVTGISSTIVAIFIIFGGFLLTTGCGENFIDLAIWFAGRFFGGAAKVSVIASGFFGMMSGSAVANVATTGNFTIPLMKKLKYGSEFAAGVEATASAGGQITPPIMGAGAFLMAELLEMPYIQVAICAAIPAFLYYLSILSAIHFESVKRNLGCVPKEDIKPMQEIIKPSRSLPLFIPIIILLTLMLKGRTPETSAFWAILSFAVLYIFSTFEPAAIKSRLFKFFTGMYDIGASLIKVVPLLVCANIIVSLISLTGIGVNLSELLMGISGDHILLALLLAALVTLMLGMGIPTPAAYLLGASVLAPSLKAMGFHPLACHMFIFYFAILSALTPPVCAGVYVAAGIANADWLKTAWVSMRLAIVKYILPFMFIFNISLLFLGSAWKIAWSIGAATVGAYMIAGGTMGYFFGNLGILTRLGIIVASLLCLTTTPLKVVIGVVIGVGIVLYQKNKKKVPQRSKQQAVV